ncbi:hypothetical protein H4R34_005176 [Dimargaris verticillata]|uniref:Uncharacterized protein n=1 Tax=Dimargaris verticillata TaxID=2761393 RepID=A0A9W8E6G0_9FUNG|nr:hypothetical protein H4R34_005176 [Dimargaris verticillata]
MTTGISTTERHPLGHQVAFYRQSPSGYLFSGPIEGTDPSDVPQVDGLRTVSVFPAIPVANSVVPRLADAQGSNATKPIRVYRRSQPAPTIARSLNYGPFSSCFPFFDSNQAYLGPQELLPITTVAHESILPFLSPTNSPDLTTNPSSTVEDAWTAVSQLAEKYQTNDGSLPDTALDQSLFAEWGIDVDALVNPSPPVVSPETQLDQCTQLLLELEAHQSRRLGTTGATAGPSDAERAAAEKLRKRLASLVAQASPGDLVTLQQVQHAMSHLSFTETFYRGTLSLQKCFAYPSSAQLAKDLDPRATEFDA